MLVLDEPTAALDPASERQVVESYQAVMRGRTTIVISHRAAVAEAADQVAVVEGSRLVEVGPPAALSASGGAFARLFARRRRRRRMTGVLSGLTAGTIATATYPDATGRGVRVAVIDSGVHAAHPHVSRVEGGVSFDAAGTRGDDAVDRLGHGTAVAAAIREKAPETTLVPVKVFDRELRATVNALVAAIDWAIAARVHIINLSLGTANAAHEARLSAALRRATEAGICLVAAAEQDGIRWLPGSLPHAVGVTLDWVCPREQAEVAIVAHGAIRRVTMRASGYPRPIPGVPPERNLKGLSFAVANATGLLCRHVSRGLAR